MYKRGQITIFVILGIIIALLIILFFFARNFGIVVSPVKFLGVKSAVVDEHIKNCIKNEAPNLLNLIARQGGTLEPEFYRYYNNYEIQYLCFNMENTEKCRNKMLLKEDMEKELEIELEKKLLECASLKSLKGFGYDVEAKNLKVKVMINDDNTLIKVNYPITLIKGKERVEISDFSERFFVPLGDLYDVSRDILDYETEFGVFDTQIYMLAKKGNYLIEKKQPYPDKVYITRLSNQQNYIFQFAIESEPLYEIK